MKAFYASRLSEHIAQTPEGYLICKNVPIARTGWQDYARSELKLDGDGLAHVWRDPEEVFHAATIASFEGKTVADGHPPEFISSANEGSYHRGHAQHIRRGSIEGTTDEVLLADLVVKDSNLVSKILGGLREISCGYECEYVSMGAMDYDYRPSNGNGNSNYAQRDIRGNHIAVVPSGRAGEAVCIRDSAESVTERRPIMNLARHIFGLGLKSYVKDTAEPEAVANAFDDFTARSEARTKERNKDDDDKTKDDDKARDDDDKAKDKKVADAMDRMTASVNQMNKFLKRMAALDDETDDDDVIATDEEADDDDDKVKDEEEKESEDADLIPVATLPASERPCNPIPGADALKKYLLSVKPIVAKSKDAKAIKEWNRAYRAVQPPRNGRTRDGYRKLLNRQKPEEVATAEMRLQMTDKNMDPSADFLACVKPYHGRNILEVAKEREVARVAEQQKRRVN